MRSCSPCTALGAGLLLFFAAARQAGSGATDGERVTATSKGHAVEYVARTIAGFHVRVDARLLAADSPSGAAALELLQGKLQDVARAVRADRLARLREVPLWLSLDDPCAPCACYHESPEWLEQNGFDPQKAKAVEICNAGAFLEWTHEQPWMVLHELAHAWQDRFLPLDDPLERELEAAFVKAQDSGRYAQVLHWDGKTTRHYAMNDVKEYFAEGSEAWLGCNDFHPFVAAELRVFDADLAAVLGKIWGEPITSVHPDARAK